MQKFRSYNTKFSKTRKSYLDSDSGFAESA